MNERRGRPFKRPMKEIEHSDHKNSARSYFLRRLQLLDIGATYSVSKLEIYFNLRYHEGLSELLELFTKWKKVDNGYELLEKKSLAVQENLPSYLETNNKEYSEIVNFLSHVGTTTSFSVKDILDFYKVDLSDSASKKKTHKFVNLLQGLKYRKQIEIDVNQSPLKYRWIGEKLNEQK